jgi:hypothetical protein
LSENFTATQAVPGTLGGSKASARGRESGRGATRSERAGGRFIGADEWHSVSWVTRMKWMEMKVGSVISLGH